MQSAITMEDTYRGVSQEERILLRQLFDKIIWDTSNEPNLPNDLTSNQGEKNDVINQ